VLASRIVGLQDVRRDGAAFNDRSAVCRDEDRRLSQLLDIEEFRRRAIAFVSFVKGDIIFDGELFEEPDHTLGLRVLLELAVASMKQGIDKH
jgi:hypothetical protein